MTKISSMAMVLCLVFFEGLAQAVSYDRPKIQLPGPQGYVSDHAQAIDGDWKERIRSVCQDLERKTGVEMVVVTVPTIKPFGSANEYATALYEKWGIGSTQQEHGVMVLVAVQERQAAITLGRQMLPVITPAVMNQVGHESLQPSIELGHFGEGLYLTVVALASPAQEVRVGDHREGTFQRPWVLARPLYQHRGVLVLLVDQPTGPSASLQTDSKRRVLGNRPGGLRGELRRIRGRDERGGWKYYGSTAWSSSCSRNREWDGA